MRLAPIDIEGQPVTTKGSGNSNQTVYGKVGYETSPDVYEVPLHPVHFFRRDYVDSLFPFRCDLGERSKYTTNVRGTLYTNADQRARHAIWSTLTPRQKSRLGQLYDPVKKYW